MFPGIRWPSLALIASQGGSAIFPVDIRAAQNQLSENVYPPSMTNLVNQVQPPSKYAPDGRIEALWVDLEQEAANDVE